MIMIVVAMIGTIRLIAVIVMIAQSPPFAVFPTTVATTRLVLLKLPRDLAGR